MTEAATMFPIMPYSWQQEQWQQLQTLIENQRLPHALLLSGSRDIGKTQFARALAQLLLCEAPVLDKACGHCKQCYLLAAGSHPDLRLLEPEAEGKAIKVDDVRAVGDFVAKTAQQGGWKITIIQPAEAMNVNAANALLKNLEEPGKNTLIILVAHELERIPATVRSRCRILKFPRPESHRVRNWLQQVVGDGENIDQLLQFSDGRPLLALKLLQTDALSKRLDFETLVNEVAAGEKSALPAAAWCKTEDPLQVVEWFQHCVVGRIKAAENHGSTRLLFRFMDRLLVAKQRLQSRANPNELLLWEELLLDWQALFKAIA